MGQCHSNPEAAAAAAAAATTAPPAADTNMAAATTTTSKKIIAVVGATGAQGGGLVRKILADKEGPFAVRALTRDPSKDAAQAFAQAGAEVVAFDMDKPETYGPALEGVYGLFVVTNFWEHFSATKEVEQAKMIVEAGEKAGVSHYIWSTLEDSVAFFDAVTEDQPPKIKDGFYVPHLDGKALANGAFPKDKVTLFYTSFYLENFWNFGMVKDGTMCNNMGDAPLPTISAEDIGKSAYGIFKGGLEGKYKGESVYAAGDRLTCAQMMDIATEVTGKPFKFAPVDRATYAGFGFPGADDLANMFDFNARCEDFAANRDPAKGKELNPEMLDFRAWAEKNKEALLKCA